MLGGFSAATGIVKLSLDTGTFEQDSKALNSTLEKNLGALNKLDTAAKGFLLGASAGLSFFLHEASQAQEVIQKFEAVFKEESDAANEFVNELASTLGRSTTDLKRFLSTLQDTFVPLGFGRAEARKLSQSLVALALDLAAFNDKADDDVIRDLQSALVGNTETVRKYGIVITETRLKQEAFNRGMDPKTLTEAEKAMLRFNIILEGSKDALGTAEREAASFAGQMKVLKAGLQETAETIGAAFLPDAEAMLETINQVVSNIVTWVQANKELLVENTKLAAQIAASIIIFKALLTTILAVRTAMIAMAAAQIGLGITLATLGPLALALGATAIALGVLNDEVRRATATFDEFDGKINKLDESLKDAKTSLVSLNEEMAQGNNRGVTELEKAATDLLDAHKALEKVKEDAKNAFNNQKGFFENLLDTIWSGKKVEAKPMDDFIDVKKYDAAIAKIKETQMAFDGVSKTSKKLVSTQDNINKLKVVSASLDKMILKNTELFGSKADSQVEKIKRQLSLVVKELEARRAIQFIALLNKDISEEEEQARLKIVMAIDSEIVRIGELSSAKITAAQEAASAKEAADKASKAKEEKRNRDSFLDFVETEKEKSTRYIEEEEKRLKAAAKTDEERDRIGKAADKKIRDLAGKDVTRSSGVKSFDALQEDILKNEDEGLALQKDANKKLDEIAKNTANRGGLT